MLSPNTLEGKYAIVTGGSRGIGAAIALKFAEMGIAGIAITYSTNEAAAQSVLEKMKTAHPSIKSVSIQANLVDPEAAPRIVSTALASLETKTIDILVNNAALISMDSFEPFQKISPQVFTNVMLANVYSPIALIRSVFPHLPARGGRIVNISSTCSKTFNADPLFTYGASKAALDSFSRCIARVFAREKLFTINSVVPGTILTEAIEVVVEGMPKEWNEKKLDEPSAETRFGTPQDVADIVGWLASEESRWVHGQCIGAHGGIEQLLALQG